MERVRLHRLRQTLDAQGRVPRRLAQAESGLDVRDLAGEKGRGDFYQRLRALGGQTEPRVRRNRDVAANGLRLRNFHARQGPLGIAKRLVAFEAKLNDLPGG